MLLSAVLAFGLAAAGCGSNDTDTSQQAEAAAASEEEERSEVIENADSEEEAANADDVATDDEMTARVEVVEDGMEPVYADSLKDGVYSVKVDSSSTMFNITACQLIVEQGEMRAVMTMHGKGYLYVYPGTGQEAASAPDEERIPYVENEEGAHTYEIPVEALDMGIDCAAFSKNKEKWYDRTLVFRADSLPQEAFAEGVVTTLEDLELEDGQYQIDVRLEGGSGRASVESPARLRVENGSAFATIVWSSSNYDYMKVDDVQYDLLDTEGNSAFEIPVTVFDWKMAVLADTTAMSVPHEIEYTLYFDSSSITPSE